MDTPENNKTKRIFGASSLAGLALLATQTLPPNTIYNPSNYAHAESAASIDQAIESTIKYYPMTPIDITGRSTEPINIVFLGDKDQLSQAFSIAGWKQPDSIADPIAVAKAIDAYSDYKSTDKNDSPSYPTMPFSPSFFKNVPHDIPHPPTIAFENQRYGNAAFRDHGRIWQTKSTVQGKTMWVGSFSYDNGYTHVIHIIPIHHIDPNIDTERTVVDKTLTSTGSVSTTSLLPVWPVLTDQTTEGGNTYSTDGKVLVLTLK